VRYFFRRRLPKEFRVLLVESGSRHLVESVLPHFYRMFGAGVPIGLVTCYSGLPAGFPPDARVFHIADYAGSVARKRLYRELAGYTVLGILCSAEPIMTKWKWAIAANIPAKIIIINENRDFFWFDRSNWRSIREFLIFRAGLAGAGAVRTLGRLVLFPFTLLYLLLYAGTIHLKRKVFG
jgi:hypothetical protein